MRPTSFIPSGSRPIIQDFVPISSSLEWELGLRYYSSRGNKAFVGDARPIPFVVNNDGTLSGNAAETFFASLRESEAPGMNHGRLVVAEIGIGTGLFARYFLDHFRDLCNELGKDYYHRLTYIAGDFSPKMLKDLVRSGILANHPGRFVVRKIDATSPRDYLLNDVLFHDCAEQPLRAVFLNYLLDSLPAKVLDRDGVTFRELYVRACVARNIRLEDHTDMSLDALKFRAESNDPDLREEILEIYGLLASEYDYRRVDMATVPYGDFAAEFLTKRAKKLLHNHGAITCLEQLLTLLHPEGFILVNDYGQTQIELRDEFEHQRFSYSTSVGINFPLLKAYFDEGKRAIWVEPFGEAGGVHARLIAHHLSHATRERFQALFGSTAYEHRMEPWNQARECMKVGRFELALTYYQQAMDRNPNNWVLLNEVASLLIFQLREIKAGIDAVKLALRLNPSCSSDLWTTLGDGLFEFGRIAEAKSAYLRAMEINPSDMRSRFHLALVYQREKDYEAALSALAEALALDRTGDYRERMLHKQQEILSQLMMRHQQEYLLLVNLVSRYDKKDAKPPTPGESP